MIDGPLGRSCFICCCNQHRLLSYRSHGAVHCGEGVADARAECRDDPDAGDQDQGKHDCVFDGGGSVIAGQETGNRVRAVFRCIACAAALTPPTPLRKGGKSAASGLFPPLRRSWGRCVEFLRAPLCVSVRPRFGIHAIRQNQLCSGRITASMQITLQDLRLPWSRGNAGRDMVLVVGALPADVPPNANAQPRPSSAAGDSRLCHASPPI